MADAPSENEALPQQEDADLSVVSEDTSHHNMPFIPHQQQQQQQWHHPYAPARPPQHPAVAMAQYYEAQMRDHAAAYASAAAGAAWAASQIASCANMPPTLPPVPPAPMLYNGGYEQHHHQQPWHPPPQVSEELARPGKRQQRMHVRGNDHHSTATLPPSNTPPRPSRRQDYRSSEKRGRRRMRPDTNSSDNSSSRGRRRPHQQARKRSTERTLLGKTGVSALHEWCAKMKLPLPQFILQPPEDEESGFCMSVHVNGQEHGRGRGGTKGTAKQAAARQAMQSLLPGVVFDTDGLLVELPTSSSLGDLAPNLASRLAIDGSNKKRQPSSRTWDVYPGTTSTTSEEDNDYLASRGASVCSALLHALWQIDDDIPEPPSYTYEICAAADAKRKQGAVGGAIAVRRSSFACTARLIVKRPLLNESINKESTLDKATNNTEGKASSKKNDDSEDQDQFHVETLTAVGTAASKREARHAASAKLLALLFPECNGMVEVKAAAEAVREKYAAEKALVLQSRRTVTLEKRMRPNSESTISSGKMPPRKRSSIDFATPDESDPPLPDNVARHLRSVLGLQATVCEDDKASADDDVVSVESLSLSDKAIPREDKKPAAVPPHIEASLSRSLSRKKQLDERVDAALLVMNELDEEGRSLPEQLSSNDVGRTVLRRAESEDADWIQRLLANQDADVSHGLTDENEAIPGPLSLLGVSLPSSSASRRKRSSDNADDSLSLPSRLWGSTAITLLLCRVISPKADPPLGCAVLTLGFSMDKGPLLRIAELASEPHLPKERFIECLDKFASHMKCTLGNDTIASGATNSTAPGEVMFSPEQLKSIVEAHLDSSVRTNTPTATNREESDRPQGGTLDLKTLGASLQSVQEEEAEDEKDKEDLDEAKGDKPCKRSRVV